VAPPPASLIREWGLSAAAGYAPRMAPDPRLVTPASAPVPRLLPGQPPMALLIDYDGTISQVDVSEQILERFFRGNWHEDDQEYVSGLIGSRTFFERQMPRFAATYEEVVTFAESQPHDRAFAGFVRRADELEIPLEVVSDGLGFFIGAALERLGVPHLTTVTATTRFENGKALMTFPNGHPEGLVCGTCKRNRVLAHQAAGRMVVFVGDGESDLYAAAHADVIFAKGTLPAFCDRFGWPYARWSTFDDVRAWLEATYAAWSADPASLAGPHRHRLVCGPEIWGPGRVNPPPDEPMRQRRAGPED
jgi:2-hydroxy-3-keto-5-methylthiopentenyl-1-phosphate phosphatase